MKKRISEVFVLSFIMFFGSALSPFSAMAAKTGEMESGYVCECQLQKGDTKRDVASVRSQVGISAAKKSK